MNRVNILLNNLINFYKNGTDGVILIYLSVVFTLLYYLFDFIFIKIFSISLAPFFLLSIDNVFPYVWTIITFLFIHKDILELLFYMLLLFSTERIFRTYFNRESFIKFFFLGNLIGVLVFLGVSFLQASHGLYLNGVILGVYSVFFAIISYMPKFKITLFPLPIGIPFYMLGIVLIVLEIFNFHIESIAVTASKFSAIAFGYFYMKSFQKGNDFLGKLVPNFYRFKEYFFIKKNSFKFKLNKTNRRSKTDEEFNLSKMKKQKDIDKILDKISQEGYESLTKEEKAFLFDSSK